MVLHACLRARVSIRINRHGRGQSCVPYRPRHQPPPAMHAAPTAKASGCPTPSARPLRKALARMPNEHLSEGATCRAGLDRPPGPDVSLLGLQGQRIHSMLKSVWS
jgi:hypothetical protein